MKTSATIVVLVSVQGLFVQQLSAERFQGSGSLGTSTLNITNFSLSFTPTYTVDFETTGQSVHFNQFDVDFEGIIPVPNHSQVYIELDMHVSISDYTVDINPVFGEERWRTEEYYLPIMTLTGTYHSFDYEYSFDITTLATDNPWTTDLRFTDYPNSIDFGQFSSGDSIFYDDIDIELEPQLFLNYVRLESDFNEFLTATAVAAATCPCCDCADFNEDGRSDGLDFLAWQQGSGTLINATLADGDGNGDGSVNSTDLAIWETHYTAVQTPTIAAVPEPTAFNLALAVLCLAMGWRQTL